jgi:hypothetical protein
VLRTAACSAQGQGVDGSARLRLIELVAALRTALCGPAPSSRRRGGNQGVGQAPVTHHEPALPAWSKLMGTPEVDGSFLQWCLAVIQDAAVRPTSAALTCQSRAAVALS